MTGASGATLWWLRRDLRLDDNPALAAACARGPVVPVFVWCPREEGRWAPGAASRVWLHHALAALHAALRRHGLRLVVRHGPTLETLAALAAECDASAVYWNRLYDPASTARDTQVKGALRERGLEARSFNGALLNEPWAVASSQGRPFRVFTPFHRHCLSLGPPRSPAPAPGNLPAPRTWPAGDTLDALALLPRIDWAVGIREAWTPGEAGAQRELAVFVDGAAAHYATGRDLPATDGVSRLSPHLHFGEISPHRVWHAVSNEAFTRQLYWREFAHHLLFHFPHTPDEPLYPRYKAFPWREDGPALGAWQRGRTGYPLVDAGMRELWHTGWMHNRVRMNVASFLVKHLLLDWRAGARWFWDTLVDADLASNTMGWQWAAGCGADAAPYFRIFNPVRQGGRFDPGGRYVRRWLPELARLPPEHVHAPWAAPTAVLEAAGVRLGHDYPWPVVEHAAARRRALAALETLRGA